MPLKYLLVVFILLFKSDCLWAQSGRAVESENQKKYIAKFICSKIINEKIEELLKDKASVPGHLNFKSLVIKMDVKDLSKMMLEAPPEIRKKMEMAAKQTGKSVEALMSELESKEAQDNFDKNVGGTPPGFMSKTHGYIKVVNLVPKACGKECEHAVEENVVLAFAFWRNACHLCTDDFMSFIKVSESLFVDSRILDWMDKSAVPEVKTYPMQNRSASFLSRAVSLPNKYKYGQDKANIDYGQFLSYSKITSDYSNKLCRMSIDRVAAPRSLLALRHEICKDSPERTMAASANMKITLLPGRTQCGPAQDYIGCGIAGNEIEISFSDAAFWFVDFSKNRKVEFGYSTFPPESGTNLLIHEVGHWFGLPHVNDDKNPVPAFLEQNIPDVMQNSLGDATCASELSLRVINNMSDKSYQAAFIAGNGLRRGALRRSKVQ